MNKNTMLYGLLIAGGLLAYFAWKKKNESSVKKSGTTSNSNSGTFVDDVPVSKKIADKLLQEPNKVENPVQNINTAVSRFVEPLIGVKKQSEILGKGLFVEL